MLRLTRLTPFGSEARTGCKWSNPYNWTDKKLCWRIS